MSDFHSGKRLNRIRIARRVRLKELADAFKVSPGTIQQWQLRGVPAKAVDNVASFFDLEKWVFSDPALTEENFETIIANPKLQDVYRPSADRKPFGSLKLLMTEKGKGKRAIHSTRIFKVRASSILLHARVGGGEEEAVCQFLLHKKEDKGLRSWEKKYVSEVRGRELTLSVWTRPDTTDENEIIQEKIINGLDEGGYYLSIHSVYRYEVSVFELTL